METQEKTEESDNVIYIGQKSFMAYVTSTILQFSKTDTKNVIIKARGKFTAKAIDVAEVVVRKFLKERKIVVTDVKIGSEEYTNKENKKANVSVIEITLG